MFFRIAMATAVVVGFAGMVTAQERPAAEPEELAVIKSYVGVWDAEIEVWANGPDAPSTRFKGVETNRPYGQHWIASDFDSEIMGQTMKVHSIIGYDLDKKKLVGTIIDHGPYSASMTGEYDAASKSVAWVTQAKTPDGNPMVQKTVIRQTSPNERMLVLSVPGENEGETTKFMQIKFIKRK